MVTQKGENKGSWVKCTLNVLIIAIGQLVPPWSQKPVIWEAFL